MIPRKNVSGGVTSAKAVESAKTSRDLLCGFQVRTIAHKRHGVQYRIIAKSADTLRAILAQHPGFHLVD